MNPHLAAALAKRGRTWGAGNAETLHAMRRGVVLRSHGGPSLAGRHPLGAGGFRRYAAPAP